MTNSKPSNQSPKPHPDLIRAVLANGIPLLDVRAESEFAQGSIPNSTNLPILNDQERTRVGTTYKQQGSAAAERVGQRLVHGQIRTDRTSAWANFCKAHTHAYLTCWRGGRRSEIAQSWLSESGIEIDRIPGGYKSMRQACLATLANENAEKDWLVLAGKTGTAKTVVINQVTGSIDLEGIANHRGSAFGARATPQPTPATFENQLAAEFLRHNQDSLLVEDESRTIGRLALPESWHTTMQAAPVVLIETSLEFRSQHIKREYVTEPMREGVSAATLKTQYLDALNRINRRLGGFNYKVIAELLSDAFAGRRDHGEWIAQLLEKYYDPMYQFQLKNKHKRVVMKGDHSAVLDYLSDRGHGGVL